MNWAFYLLQVNIYLILFYGFYKLLLAKETLFKTNRFYLLATSIFAFVIPYLKIDWPTEVQPATINLNGQISTFTTDFIASSPIVIEEAKTNYFGAIVSLIYLVGITFFFIRLLIQLNSVKQKFNEAETGTAFSFFNRKIVSPDLAQPQIINLHEDVHIKQLHTLDVLFFEILAIILWFNPMVYYLKNDIKEVHEFLADDEVASLTGDKESYAYLLLSNALNTKDVKLFNQFNNQPILKKRISMIYKEKKSKIAWLKYGLAIPLFALAILLSSAKIKEDKNLISITDEIAFNTNVLDHLTFFQDTVYSFVSMKTPPKFNGGIAAFYKYMTENIRYPEDALNNNIQGNVFLTFIVEKDGSLSNIKVHRSLGYGTDEEAIRVLKNSPKWIPGEINENPVRVKYNIPIKFSVPTQKNSNSINTKSFSGLSQNPKKAPLFIVDGKQFDGDVTKIDAKIIESVRVLKPAAAIKTYGDKAKNGAIIITKKNAKIIFKNDDSTVHSFVTMENPPTYPGGISKFYDFLNNNIKYPEEALKNNVQGNVYVSFVIEEDGKLADIKIDRGLGSGTDEEAVRVLKLSEKWNPGSIDGKKVRVKYNIPIKFAKKFTLKELTSDPEKKPLFIVDGEEISDVKSINSDNIESVSVFKNNSDVFKKYGTKAKNGVVVMTTKTAKNKKLAPAGSSINDDEIYSFVSINNPPSYLGGIDKFYKFLGENIKYPEEAIKNKVQGNVYLSFVVEKDGSLSNIKVDRRLGSGTDEEAVRVLSISPKWNPGTKDGNPVRVKYNLPIRFSLPKK